MQVEFIETSVGKFQIFRNEKPESFYIELVENAEYEGVTVVVNNYYTVSIDISSFAVGDVSFYTS